MAAKLVPFEILMTARNAEQRLTVLAENRQQALDAFLVALGFVNFHRERPGRCRIDVDALRRPRSVIV
jgi:hypothetical protein